jgi:hypothetical protein
MSKRLPPKAKIGDLTHSAGFRLTTGICAFETWGEVSSRREAVISEGTVDVTIIRRVEGEARTSAQYSDYLSP